MAEIFLQISIILLIVLVVSFVMRLLKQPLIIGYILAGILCGPVFLNLLSDNGIISTFSELGIAFLLFLVGLRLSPRVIKEVGKISLITGIGQVVFTALIGYFIAILVGFDKITSLYVAIALTFSSTIIIMKLLSDKEALDKLYGRISIGFLLVQDLIAVIILMVISSFSGSVGSQNLIISSFLKAAGIFLVLIPVSHYLLPRLGDFFARSQEVLFVFALAWGLGIASLFYFAGFSIEVGALIAGVMLSMSSYSLEVSSKLKPLRDFFIISFFILLGSQMIFSEVSNLIIPAVIFSLFILIGNPLIVIALMGMFGYSKNTGFMSGLTVAQISEFSLILIALGVKVGHISSEILSFVTIIGLVTIAGSTYLIMFSDKIYPFVSKYLSVFEKKSFKRERGEKKNFEYLLFGENRIGFSIMRSFLKNKRKYLIVDFNPHRVSRLNKKRVNCIYGDISDSDFLDELKISKAKFIASTIPDVDVSMMIVNKVREKSRGAIVIVTARQISEAFDLYTAGADYVILPQLLGGSYVADLMEKAGEDKYKYDLEKKKHIKDLKERLHGGEEEI